MRCLLTAMGTVGIALQLTAPAADHPPSLLRAGGR